MAKTLPNDTPFREYKIYGPYLHSKMNRHMVFLIHLVTKKRTSMSYARYLMCVAQKRWLNFNEEIDHIDDNRLNNDLSNLQILTPKDNRVKNSRGRTMVTLSCPNCKIPFTRERRKTHLVQGGNPSSCSRRCGGILSIQTFKARRRSSVG